MKALLMRLHNDFRDRRINVKGLDVHECEELADYEMHLFSTHAAASRAENEFVSR